MNKYARNHFFEKVSSLNYICKKTLNYSSLNYSIALEKLQISSHYLQLLNALPPNDGDCAELSLPKAGAAWPKGDDGCCCCPKAGDPNVEPPPNPPWGGVEWASAPNDGAPWVATVPPKIPPDGDAGAPEDPKAEPNGELPDPEPKEALPPNAGLPPKVGFPPKTEPPPPNAADPPKTALLPNAANKGIKVLSKI